MLKSKLESEYSKCTSNSCIVEITDKLFWVYDDEIIGRTFICNNSSVRKDVCIKNSNKKPIKLLSIDACLFTNELHKRCDFAVFDEKKICFCEIKQGNKPSIAKEQLYTAINELRKKINFEILNYKIEAYSCVNLKKYTGTHPSVSASDLSTIAYFASIGVKLFINGNTIEFN